MLHMSFGKNLDLGAFFEICFQQTLNENSSKNKKAEGQYYLAQIRWSKKLIHEPSITSHFGSISALSQ